MKIREIVKDSLLYPFSKLGNFLLLGFFVVLCFSGSIVRTVWGGQFSFGILTLVFIFVVFGLFVKVIRSSFAEFRDEDRFFGLWSFFADGFKAFVIGALYVIPFFGLIFAVTDVDFSSFWNYTPLLYLSVVAPFYGLSLANMTYSGKLENALDFNGIIGKISRIGWGSFVVWYLFTVAVVSLVLYFGGLKLGGVFNRFWPVVGGLLFVFFVVCPYVFMFFFRSSALFYISEGDGYLVCDECEGYYELSFGERVDDFSDKCQCGGKLRFVEGLDQVNDLDDKKQGFRMLLTKRKLLFGLLILIIGGLIVFPHAVVTKDKTLIGTYNVSNNGSETINDTIVYIPNGTTYIEVEYNLTWTPSIYGAKDGSFRIDGFSSHVIERELETQSYKYLVDDDGVSVPENDPNKNYATNS